MINEVDKLQSFRHLENRENGIREMGYEIKRMHVPFHSHLIDVQCTYEMASIYYFMNVMAVCLCVCVYVCIVLKIQICYGI